MLTVNKWIRLRYVADCCFAVNIHNNRIIKLGADMMHALENDLKNRQIPMAEVAAAAPRVQELIKTLIANGILEEAPDETDRNEKVVR